MRERYHRALVTLPPGDYEIIIGLVEQHLSYEQLAERLGKRSAAAARAAANHALIRLAAEMRRLASGG